MIRKNKKGVSPIVATILLILLTIVLIFTISTFVVPFVKDQLSRGDCFSYVGKLEVTDNIAYTCYKSTVTPKIMNVQVHRGDVDLNSMKIIIGGASSSIFIIKDGITDPNIVMFDGTTTLTLPQKNGEKTYTLKNVNTIPESISVAPVMTNGKTCDLTDTVTFISACS